MTNRDAIYCLKSESKNYDEICNDCPLYGIVEEDNCYEYTLEMSIKALEEQDKHKWILCSERLPSFEECFFKDEHGDYEPNEIIVMVKGAIYPTIGYYIEKRGWCRDYTKDNYGYGSEIIAWMPLPEPYQGK